MRVPRAARTNFESGVIAPQTGPNLGAISQGFAGLGAGISDVGHAIKEVKHREDMAKAVEYDAKLQVEFHTKYNQSIKHPEIMDNPEKARTEVNRIYKDILGSKEFASQSAGVKRVIKSNLAGYRKRYLTKSLVFESDQRTRNTAKSMDSTLEAFEIQALESDENVGILLDKFVYGTKSLVEGGVYKDIEQAEKHMKFGTKSILAYRAQRLINQGDIEGVQKILKDDGYKSILGADGIQRVKSSIRQRKSLNQAKRDKNESLRLTKPWEYYQGVGDVDAPDINFRDFDNLADSIDKRMTFVKDKNKQYGLNLPVLRPLDVQRFTLGVDREKPAGASKMLSVMSSKMTDEQLDALAAQLSETRPDIGSALSFAGDDLDFAHKILNGALVRKSKTVALPDPKKIMAVINDKVKGASLLTGHKKLLIDTVVNAYADSVDRADVSETELIGDDVHESEVDDLIEKAMGEKMDVGIGTTYGFKRKDGKFVDDDDFENAYNGIREDELIATHGSAIYDEKGRKVDLADVLDEAKLIMIGDGKYRVRVNGFDYQTKSNKPFNLNMKKALRAYESRPKLTVGGRHTASAWKLKREKFKEDMAKHVKELEKLNEVEK